MAIVTNCRQCGRELILEFARIAAGGWQVCDACRAAESSGDMTSGRVFSPESEKKASLYEPEDDDR